MEPRLWELLERGSPDDEVEAIVRLRHAEDVPAEIRIVARFGEIATCRLRRGAIVDVRKKVESLKAPSYLAGEPEAQPAAAEDDTAPTGTAEPEERRPDVAETGRGVIVGVVDFGFDFAHPEFVNEDGTSRILFLWDQRGPSPVSDANRYGKGRIYGREEITAALASDDPYATLDYDTGSSKLASDHGTHVMAIAAGNGRAEGPVGVAPAADLICVHLSAGETRGLANFGDSVSLLEAVDFVFNAAGDRPCVVNLSMGLTGGPHDGLTLAEQALDRAVTGAGGRHVVQSCGNYRERRTHAAGRLGNGERHVLRWIVDHADTTPDELEIWYPGQDVFRASLVSPEGDRFGPLALGGRAERIVIDGEEIGRFYHRESEPNNCDHLINIFLDPGAPSGEWEVEISGDRIVDGEWHAWIERDVGRPEDQSRFAEEQAVALTTTGTIANGFKTVTVGAYDSHAVDRPPAPFSSVGPTRDGRPKPDLVAPGVGVRAAGSVAHPDSEAPLLIEKSGTSMAAPHVTGTVALMYEAAGRALDADDVRNLLLESVDPPSPTEQEPARLGRGYLNSKQAVDRARPAAPAAAETSVDVASEDEAEPAAPVPMMTDEISTAAEETPDSPDLGPDGSESIATGAASLQSSEEMLDFVEQELARGSRKSTFDIVLDYVNSTVGANRAIEGMSALTLPKPSAALLFDTLAYQRGGSMARAIAEHFEVVARPGDPVPDDLQAGDIVIERALGEGRLAHASVIAGPVTAVAEMATATSLQEAADPQLAIPVVKTGRFPRSREDQSFARLSRGDWRLTPSTLVLRVRDGTPSRNPGETRPAPASLEGEPAVAVPSRRESQDVRSAGETVLHECRPGEGPPAALPDPDGRGLHPLVFRGTSRRYSRNPTVGDAQMLLNRFLEGIGGGTHRCEQGADLQTIRRMRATLTRDPLAVDCRFGPDTQTATKMFQRCVFPGDAREWDGKIGPKTWRELESLRARPGVPPRRPPPPARARGSLIDLDYLRRHAAAMRYVKLSSGSPAFFTGVTPLVHGDNAFDALRDELLRARDEIFLVTWFCEPDMELDRSNWDQPVAAREIHRLERILLDRARAGVTVRMLVWNFLNLGLAPPGASSSGRRGPPRGLSPIMSRVRRLGAALHRISPRNEVVIDEHPSPFATRVVFGISAPLGGSHHTKIWITRSGNSLVGFVGGMNLRQHDWDTAAHDVRNPRRNPPDMDGAERRRRFAAGEDPADGPRHDWMVRLEGQGAYRLLEEFNLRWGMAGRPRLTLPSLASVPRVPGGVFVQKSHTLPVTFGGGSREILEVYEHAIGRARRYVYIENQYWTSEALTRALANRLRREADLQVVIVLPDKAEDPVVGSYIAGEQWHQLSELWRAGGTSRVRVYTLYKKHPLRPEYVNVYVHSKVAIIDDLWATIGSANTNNRSMILDTECNVQIAHELTVKSLRQQIWRELLGSAPAVSDDPVEVIRRGWHPIGESNEALMGDNEELRGLIVPLRRPEELRRLPEELRPFL